jgi:hypothetical protein
MRDLRAGDWTPYRGVSILLHGSGERAMAVFASALAHEEAGTFGWADFIAAPEAPEPGAQRVLEESAHIDLPAPARADELLPPADSARTVSTWLAGDPLAADAAARLAAYLRLPSLLQRIVSRVVSVNAQAVVVLTNVDTVESSTLERTLGSPEVHGTLHREGVTMIVTFRGTPTELFQAPFDRVYRVEGQPEGAWQDARATLTRGEPGDGFSAGETLGRRLPWLGPSGMWVEGQRPIQGHRLR